MDTYVSDHFMFLLDLRENKKHITGKVIYIEKGTSDHPSDYITLVGPVQVVV